MMSIKSLRRLLKKQGHLVKIAKENGINPDLPIADVFGSPTIKDLSCTLFSVWELEIDKAIKFIETHCFKPDPDNKNYKPIMVHEDEDPDVCPLHNPLEGPSRCPDCR